MIDANKQLRAELKDIAARAAQAPPKQVNIDAEVERLHAIFPDAPQGELKEKVEYALRGVGAFPK
ncbi:MAG: hypothetical protein M9955_16335 [Rhizobiaceae bacterium]|nr:hypothetical protein [Rhizobiaceae bacterium]